MTQNTEQPGPCPREASRRPQPAWRASGEATQETMCNCALPGAPAWLELRGRKGRVTLIAPGGTAPGSVSSPRRTECLTATDI